MLMLGLGSSVWHNGKGKKSIADKPGGCRSSVSGKGADEALGTCHRVGSAGAARDAGKGQRGRGRDCREGTARAEAELQGGRRHGHGEGGGRPRSSLKV
jgi:hypothetical protein